MLTVLCPFVHPAQPCNSCLSVHANPIVFCSEQNQCFRGSHSHTAPVEHAVFLHIRSAHRPGLDGINFANLFQRCSGSPEYTHACHDTRPHLGKSTTPSPPHAMLTRFSVRGFAKFIPFKPPPSGPCCGALSQLNFAFRGSGGVRRANLAAPHPAAEICEIYSVKSGPHR